MYWYSAYICNRDIPSTQRLSGSWIQTLFLDCYIFTYEGLHQCPISENGFRILARSQVGKLIGACSLQYRTLTNCMRWFPLPTKLPVVI